MDTDQSQPLTESAIQLEISKLQILVEEENQKIRNFKVFMVVKSRHDRHIFYQDWRRQW